MGGPERRVQTQRLAESGNRIFVPVSQMPDQAQFFPGSGGGCRFNSRLERFLEDLKIVLARRRSLRARQSNTKYDSCDPAQKYSLSPSWIDRWAFCVPVDRPKVGDGKV